MRVNDQLANSVSSTIDRLLNDRSSINQNDLLQGNTSGQKVQAPQDVRLEAMRAFDGQATHVYEVV
ncbi:MAG: hypothetical protein WC645_02475 [Candidatus Margulisiibacteriota bacterium]